MRENDANVSDTRDPAYPCKHERLNLSPIITHYKWTYKQYRNERKQLKGRGPEFFYVPWECICAHDIFSHIMFLYSGNKHVF